MSIIQSVQTIHYIRQVNTETEENNDCLRLH